MENQNENYEFKDLKLANCEITRLRIKNAKVRANAKRAYRRLKRLKTKVKFSDEYEKVKQEAMNLGYTLNEIDAEVWLARMLDIVDSFTPSPYFVLVSKDYLNIIESDMDKLVKEWDSSHPVQIFATMLLSLQKFVKGDCENCQIHKEMKSYDCTPDVLVHMGESGCIIAKEEAEQFFEETMTAEQEAEEKMAEECEMDGQDEWTNEDALDDWGDEDDSESYEDG